jgi:hypothetical protein
MFNPRSLKVCLLVFLLIGTVTGLTGCAPLVFLAANPIITAAIIAAVPAIITVYSNARLQDEQLGVKRLEAETARTTALAAAAEKLNQQVVSQRKLELELIEKTQGATDPKLKAQLEELQAKLAQDQQVISQTLDTANQEATNLANDKGALPGTTSGTPLSTSPAAAAPAATAPAPTAPPLTTSAPATGSAATAPVAPATAPLAPVAPATVPGAVPGAAAPEFAQANPGPAVLGAPPAGN